MNDSPMQRYNQLIMRCATEAASALPTSIAREDMERAWDRLKAAMKSAAMKNNDLYGCHPQSIADAVVMSALTNLYPGGPFPDVYLLPRKGILSWDISYRGMKTLAERAGFRIEAVSVHDGDDFRVVRGLRPDLHHVPHQGERTYDNLLCAYVIAWQGSSPVGFEIIGKADIAKRRGESMSDRRGRGPWRKWPVEMAVKTAVRYAIARGLVPLQESAATAVQWESQREADVHATDTVDAPLAIEGPSALDGLESFLVAQEEPEKVSVEGVDDVQA